MTPSNILKYFLVALVIGACFIMTECNYASKPTMYESKPGLSTWEGQFEKELPMLGHRNWVLVVDKAFPEQNSPGIEYIYANDSLLSVLRQVVDKINRSTHVKPTIYQDKELNYLTESQVKGVNQFRQATKSIFGRQPVEIMLHDSVFKKLNTESQLFKILVIKTNETIPYTSVFLQLNCAYWDNDREKQLRLNMNR
ncbi:MAG: hypothetical protein KGO81_01290 [Bacteroidota bacterium]|nr:hypothetical protein [Bacteroidota bacterium]